MRKKITPKKVVMKEIRNKNDIRKQIEKWQNFHICKYIKCKWIERQRMAENIFLSNPLQAIYKGCTLEPKTQID